MKDNGAGSSGFAKFLLTKLLSIPGKPMELGRQMIAVRSLPAYTSAVSLRPVLDEQIAHSHPKAAHRVERSDSNLA